MCAGGKCHSDTAEAPVDIFVAPELAGIKEWINLPAGQAGSDALTLESLRWKVVLIDFWTYSCINCQRTQPYLNSWYDKYSWDGFVIIWVHAPEFSFEKLPRNVSEAVLREGIKYPIALDNDFKTWNAYNNRYWPAKYLIDQKWNIVYKHFWEGAYAETEMKIAELLWKNVQPVKIEADNSIVQPKLTPETYLGSSRAKNRVTKIEKINDWSIVWSWDTKPEYIESLATNWSVTPNMLSLRFAAKKVFLVVSSESKKGSLLVETVGIDSKISNRKTIPITGDELYTVFESDTFQSDATILITVSPWLRLHAFTFWN